METAASGQFRNDGVRQKLSSGLSALLVVVVCWLANYKSMNCFFFADDLLCLDYLFKIFHGQSGLFVQRLVLPWQDPSVSLLYRPVCDLLFFFDYMFWHANALGYHISNLVLHSAVAVLLFFLVKQICGQLAVPRAQIIAILASAIFASYPLHVEPIVWLVGRADLSAAFFLLAAVLVSIKNFQAKKPAGVLASILYLAALLSKEAAACAPAILLAYLLLIQEDKCRLRTAIRQILPLIAVTLIYMLLRYLILGTMLGGYSASLGDAIKWQRAEQILNLDLLALLGLAGNLAVFSAQSPSILALRAIYLVLGVVLLLRLPFSAWDKKTGKIIMFFAASTAFALLPALTVLGLTGVLTNARVFYLASLFYIPLFVAAVIPTEEKQGLFLRILSASSILALSLAAIVFMVMSIKSYSPWLDGSTALRNLQSAMHGQLMKLGDGKKMIVLNQYPNFKGAHLLYEFSELKTLVGPNFFKDDLSGRLMALDEFPDFFSASTTRLTRLLHDRKHYDVQFFDFAEQKLNSVNQAATSGGAETDWEKPACTFSETKSPDRQDRAYWVSLPNPAQIDDSSQLELSIDWKLSGTRRLCAFSFSNQERVPDQSQLSVPVGNTNGVRLPYHIPTYELRKIVCQAPAKRLYVQMPHKAELLSAFLIAGRQTASLQPDLNSLQELNNGNYIPIAGKARLCLDVSRVPRAAGMILERAMPDFLFKMAKTCTRDPQTYAQLDKSIRFSSTREQFTPAADELQAGHRYAFRLIALDKEGHSCGYYSDTVCVDLRKFPGTSKEP